jgi:uncharacterized protein DUF6848
MKERTNMLKKDQIAELKAKYPGVELTRLVITGVEFVVKTPARAQYKRFLQTGRAPGVDRMDVAEVLARDCVVFPDTPGLEKLFEEKPALSLTLAGELAEIAGATEEVEKNVL